MTSDAYKSLLFIPTLVSLKYNIWINVNLLSIGHLKRTLQKLESKQQFESREKNENDVCKIGAIFSRLEYVEYKNM